ncbi:probable transmembrane ascorbate ferrireductase 4 [Andrographis paniculata]|uniref:probable transmembrane ascorbate ferrireductase 4 n=1 Tax=Andrographis paniculata TaxID=175694 RepID=UPI0021E96D36|nr:probable transmembrane ascorbate ferrireductase 4 [Andrographis paniculata]
MAMPRLSLSLSVASLVLFLGRLISGSMAAILVLIWALHFQTSFLPSQQPAAHDLIFAVLHPLFMVIGFILISGEAILVQRWLPGSKNLKKSMHLSLQGVALGCGIFGIWTKFHGQDGIMANFYTLHSWMGLISISLFAAQWLFGFINFWHKREVRTTRRTLLPWHVFLGLYTYGLAVVTAETGLLEKLTILQVRGDVLKRCPESAVVNGLGLCLALLSSTVILAAVSPRRRGLKRRKILHLDNDDGSDDNGNGYFRDKSAQFLHPA